MVRAFEYYFLVLSFVILLSGRDSIQQNPLQCGVPKVRKAGLIVQGSDTAPGDWPWHAAIYHKSKGSQKYACGGTLISGPFVLTAAHCVINPDNKHQLVESRIFVRLGIHNLDSQNRFSQRHEILRVTPHSAFLGYDFNNDIAILELETVPQWSDYVQPACLSTVKDLTDQYGTVVGWGLTEDDEVSPILRSAQMPVVDVTTCLKSNRELFGATLDDGIFCAGYRNGTNVCNGDSGGGLFFKVGNAWHLGGIVSYTEARPNIDLCRIDSYGAFTRVYDYLPWISAVTKLNFMENMEASSARDFGTSPISSTTQDRVVVCYIGSWAVYRGGSGTYSLDKFDPKLCTHAIYAFAGLDAPTSTIRSLDPWQDLKDNNGKGGYEKLISMRNCNPHLKVLLAIGGYNEGSERYSTMAANPRLRQAFVDSAVEFVKRYGFDGLDLVWQYPTQRGGESYDRVNFVLLVKKLSQQFKRNNLLLTSAFGAQQGIIDAAYDFGSLSKYLDFLHVLCYDYNQHKDKVGFNGPLQSQDAINIESTIEYLLAVGAPREKLVLGVPFYGKTFVVDSKHAKVGDVSTGEGFAGPSTKQHGIMAYYEICEALKQNPGGWTVSWDAEASEAVATMPDGNQTKMIIYDNTRSMANKVRFAIRQNLRGVVVWAVDMDDFNGRCGAEEDTYADFGGQNNNLIPPSAQQKYKLLSTINDAIELAIDELNEENKG